MADVTPSEQRRLRRGSGPGEDWVIMYPAAPLEPRRDYNVVANGVVVATFITGDDATAFVQDVGTVDTVTPRTWTAGPWSCVETSCGNPDGDSSLSIEYTAPSDALVLTLELTGARGTPAVEIPLSITRDPTETREYFGDGFCSIPLPGGADVGTDYCATIVAYDRGGNRHAGPQTCSTAQQCQLEIGSDGWCRTTTECAAPGTPTGDDAGGCSSSNGRGSGSAGALAVLAMWLVFVRRRSFYRADA